MFNFNCKFFNNGIAQMHTLLKIIMEFYDSLWKKIQLLVDIYTITVLPPIKAHGLVDVVCLKHDYRLMCLKVIYEELRFFKDLWAYKQNVTLVIILG